MMAQTLNSSQVITQSDVTFGTSGARGLVTQFTSNVCAAFSIAFVAGIKQNFSFKTVAIAIDNRPSSYAMAQATRDAVLPAIMLLVSAGKSDISTLVNGLPKRFTYSVRIQNVKTEESKTIISKYTKNREELTTQLGLTAKVIDVNCTDGLRISMSNNFIVHFRPSGDV